MIIGGLGTARITEPALVQPASKLEGCCIVGIASRHLGTAKSFASKHGIARAYGSYEELLADPQVELVYNPLPINLHAKWTIRALEAGKHVLCEKPFAMNQNEAEAMLEAANQSGRRLIEAFHYRYHPGFIQMLEFVRGGVIGDIKRVVARFTVPIADKDGTEIRHQSETGGGAFMDLGCYPLHWARTVFGREPKSFNAKAELTARGVDETMVADLRFEGGGAASLYASMAESQSFEARLFIEGTAGQIEFNNPLAPQLGSRLVVSRNGQSEEIIVSLAPTYETQLAAVIEAIETGTPLPTEGEDTLGQQIALDAVYDAAGLRDLRFR